MLSRSSLAVLLCGFLAAPAVAQTVDHATQYRACLALVYRTAEDALESALSWHAMGGGVPAQHCAALAQIEMGQFTLAAQRLEAAAQGLSAGTRISPADILGQAANAWILASQWTEAKRVLDAALTLAPDDANLLVDRARVAAADGDYTAALTDLDRALAINPEDDDAYAFKASALRRISRMEDALTAAASALALNPENPSARLERGLIRQALDDIAGARDDWLAVALDHAGTPAATTAKALLEQLDVTKE